MRSSQHLGCGLTSEFKLSKKLAFRNEELLQASNRASCKSLDTLLDLTSQGKYQQEVLVKILGNGQADSALLKTLSMVATVCLPASLVAVGITKPKGKVSC
jgi:hypothetical protein